MRLLNMREPPLQLEVQGAFPPALAVSSPVCSRVKPVSKCILKHFCTLETESVILFGRKGFSSHDI